MKTTRLLSVFLFSHQLVWSEEEPFQVRQEEPVVVQTQAAALN